MESTLCQIVVAMLEMTTLNSIPFLSEFFYRCSSPWVWVADIQNPQSAWISKILHRGASFGVFLKLGKGSRQASESETSLKKTTFREDCIRDVCTKGRMCVCVLSHFCSYSRPICWSVLDKIQRMMGMMDGVSDGSTVCL